MYASVRRYNVRDRSKWSHRLLRIVQYRLHRRENGRQTRRALSRRNTVNTERIRKSHMLNRNVWITTLAEQSEGNASRAQTSSGARLLGMSAMVKRNDVLVRHRTRVATAGSAAATRENELKLWKEECPALSPDAFIFPNPDGGSLDTSNYRNGILKPLG